MKEKNIAVKSSKQELKSSPDTEFNLSRFAEDMYLSKADEQRKVPREEKVNYTNTFWKAFDYKILVDYERAKTFVHHKKMPSPRFSNMYLTNVCNQNCQYCEYASENKLGTIMPVERVLNNIEEVSELGVKAIDFCGGGEPTLHPNLDRILNYCHQKNIVLGLFTNLAFQNDKLLETIVDCCSYVRISLDTCDEKTYNLTRRPRNSNLSFSQVTKNIQRMVEFKKNLGLGIIIGVKMLITKFNCNEIEKFIEQGIELGVDSVQFKKVSLFEDLYVTPEVEKAIEEKFSELKAKHSDTIDILQNFQDLNLKVKCFMHMNHIFIDALGDVYLCCYYLRRKSDHKLGNVYESLIKDIWYNKRHWEVAQNVRAEECNRMDCRWIKYNNLMKPFIYDDKLRQLDFV